MPGRDHARTSRLPQPYRVASSLKAVLGLQQGPLHGWGRHGIVVCLIIPYTQRPRACVDLGTRHRNHSQVKRGWPEAGLPEIRDATQPDISVRP